MPAALIVVGLGYGDEGKGAVVDHLVRRHRVPVVVRFNGGAQARHFVVSEGRKHGFSQFGAGTLAGAETILSRFVLVEPLAFCREAKALSELGVSDPFSLVHVSERAPIISPLNVLANQILEVSRGEERHGSCGMGIGLTQGDVEAFGEGVLRVCDLRCPSLVREKLDETHQRRMADIAAVESPATHAMILRLRTTDLEELALFYEEFAASLRIISEEQVWEALSLRDVVFEGAQGVLLDQKLGFFPHATRSTTTYENAETLLREAGRGGEGTRIGLLRGYATRHGAGPLPTESAELSVSPCDNGSNDWQGAFRTGWFDAVSARYALKAVGGVDLLGLTNLDRLVGVGELKAAVRYGPNRHFPGGAIPDASADFDALRLRTEILSEARVDYVPLPQVRDTDEQELFGYADAISDLIDQPVTMVSARADQHKLSRSGGGRS